MDANPFAGEMTGCYVGTVWHTRGAVDGEPRHEFRLSHRMWLLDLDAALPSGLFGWCAGDHLRSTKEAPRDGPALATRIRQLVRERVETGDLGRVRLLTMPRHLGYTFNPISVYYVSDVQGSLAAVVFEVSNTPWKDETLYVHKAGDCKDVKQMHVSPFQPMNQNYEWLAPEPREELNLRVRVSRDDKQYFEAGFKAKLSETTPSWQEAIYLTPQRAVFWIHAHAALLLAKGGRFYSHPSGTKTTMSRIIEFHFHSRYWLISWYVTMRFVSPFLSWIWAFKVIAVALRVASAPSSKRNRKVRPSQLSKRVAIVGSGIAGNGAAYELSKLGADVTVYEAADRIGGHAHTVDVDGAKVDVGFQVFNLSNYPLLTQLFQELGVDHVQSDMSLSVTSANGVSWSSKNPFVGCSTVGAFCRRLMLLFQVLAFERRAKDLLKNEKTSEESIAAWLDRHGFSESCRDDFVAPMVGAIWSSADVLETFPIAGVAHFLNNHFMLDRARPRWRTPKSRSQDYVQKLMMAVGKDRFRTSAPVTAVQYVDGQWYIGQETYDAIVFACPAASAAAALADVPGMEDCVQLISGFETTPNDVVIHKDPRFMPQDRGAWAAWNAMPDGVVTYWVNALQPGASTDDIFVTLNPTVVIADGPDKVLWRQTLSHPILDAKAARGRDKLASMQGHMQCYFAGAWCGYGFHEDGLRSAHVAVDALCGLEPQAYETLPLVRPSRFVLWLLGIAKKRCNTDAVVQLSDGTDFLLSSGGSSSSDDRIVLVAKDDEAATAVALAVLSGNPIYLAKAVEKKKIHIPRRRLEDVLPLFSSGPPPRVFGTFLSLMLAPSSDVFRSWFSTTPHDAKKID